MDTRWTRTNPHHSRCVELLLPTQALRAFLGVSPIRTERRIVSSLSVLELCPLLSPRWCASLASPPEQQPHVHTPAASFCAFLTVLPPLSVPGHLTSHHSCIGGVEKAHRELWFAWRRSQTAEIRCSRNALSVLRHCAVQFKYVEETVAVNDQRALCTLRDCPDSSTTTLADSY